MSGMEKLTCGRALRAGALGLILVVGCDLDSTLPPGSTPNARLASLQISTGALVPSFSSDTTSYTVKVGLGADAMTLTPVAESSTAKLAVRGSELTSGSESPAIALDLGVNEIDVVVADGDETSTYTVAVDRGAGIAQRAYVKASNTGNGDSFGEFLALDGDTLAVAARTEDSSATQIDGNQANDAATDSGAVYVFVRNGASWSQQAYIKASNAEAGDNFGASVAISGDTLVVGAHLEDGDGTSQADNALPGAGAAYVFVRNGTTWTQQAYLKASNPGGTDLFGENVAISGDTIAVSARLEDSSRTAAPDEGATDSGAVYVFVRNGTTWTQHAFLKASNAEADDQFGFAIALDDDTLAVSAAGEGSGSTGVNAVESDNSAPMSGAVYVFTRSGTSWSQQAYIKASNAEAGDQFGSPGLALHGDTLVVGSIAEDSASTNQADNSSPSTGAVYVFIRNGTSWAQQAYLKASNANAGDQFGFSVAIEGDVLVIGADGEDSKATGINGDASDDTAMNGGAAYLFYRHDTHWSQAAYVKASNTDANDFFHHAVIGNGTIAIGSSKEASLATGVDGNQLDNSGSRCGAVYVFE